MKIFSRIMYLQLFSYLGLLVYFILNRFSKGYFEIWSITPLGLVFDLDYLTLTLQSSCFESFNFIKYLSVLLKTIFLEFPAYYLLFNKKLPLSKTVIITIVLNLITHPIVYILFPCLIENYVISLLASELFAFSTEILLGYLLWARKHEISFFKVFFGITLANFISWQIGAFF